jgi:ABC-type transport system involved in multi-copper enzyme maturation permease subunit
MMKLSLKDLIVSRNQILISIAFWTILTPALLRSSIGIYYIAIVYGAIILFMIPLGMDNRDNTEALYLSLPIKRSEIIFSRYISSILLVVLIFAWSTLIGFLIDRYAPNIDAGFVEMISTGGVFLLFCLAVLIITIIMPVFIKFGFYSSIFAGIFISVVVLTIFILVFSSVISNNYGPLILENSTSSSMISILTRKDLIYLLGKLLGDFRYYLTIPLLIAILCLFVFISFKISTRIYSKKEF